MHSNRRQRKAFLLFLSIGAYGWIAWSFYSQSNGKSSPLLCPIKHLTGFPCPSCGSTRALLEILHGNPTEAFFLNPIAFGLALGIGLAPFLLYSEFYTKATKPTLADKLEDFFRKPLVYIPSILLVLLNWTWNITKGL